MLKADVPEVRPKNRQAVFDYVCERLAAQGRKSVRQGRCLYRSAQTDALGARVELACAVGIFLTDGAAAEADRYGGPVTSIPFLVALFADELYFMQALQVAHDGASGLNSIQERLRGVALTYNLDPSKVDLFVTWIG